MVRRCDGMVDVLDSKSSVLWTWGFESPHRHHVGADCISFAPTFFKSQSSFIPSRLLFSRDPLALGSRLIVRAARSAWPKQTALRWSGLHIVRSDFFQKSELIHFVAPPFQPRPAFAGLASDSKRGSERMVQAKRHCAGADCISFAPIFFKSQSSFIPSLLLSKSNPLRWVSIWFLVRVVKYGAFCRT